MKKFYLTLAMLSAGMTMAWAQKDVQKFDSAYVERLQEIVVKGVYAPKNAPFAVTNIKKDELQTFAKTGKELPFLFQQTPGVLAWSENGVGTGTVYMRIRGAAGSRINVTLDGVPLNSPEDQCVFWANMNSYASLLGSVQIQRGVGSSTNGDGAFGGTISMSSKIPSQVPSGEVNFSYGSYNTFNVGGEFSTGLLWNRVIVEGSYHETNTDGFIHGTSGRSGSYYGGIHYLGKKFTIRYKHIGNFEHTGQAWNGVTAGNGDLSLMDGTYGVSTGIKTYKDMYDAGLGRYNDLYERFIFNQDCKSGYTERYTFADGTLWERAIDHFRQNHNILSGVWNINRHWTTTASLHYTRGAGYYRDFRYNNKLAKFGLSNITEEDGTVVKRTDFVRKKGLKQDLYGLVWNANYKDNRWDVVGGMALQNFKANHYGYLIYSANETLRDMYFQDGQYKYFTTDARKTDGNVFVKALFHLTDQWDIFADMQYRHVDYKSEGQNDKFYSNGDGTYTNQPLNFHKKYDFFNPKAGFSWNRDGHRVYGSFAVSHREPELNNFSNNGAYPAPTPERLFDYELGYSYRNSLWNAGVNFYYMDYKDQFVQTGEKSDIGENLTTNISSSYRWGFELQAGINATPWLTVEGNAALSSNRIKDFDEVVSIDFGDYGYRTVHYDSSTLAFSPSAILNGFVNFHYGAFQAVWHTNFVSRQYLDNTENRDRSLPSFSQSDLSLTYTWKPVKVLREAVFGLNFNNIFNRRYASSGWVYSSILENYGDHPNDNRYYQIGFIPMAGFTMMGNVTLRF